jgi:hypothetical protein
MKIIKNLIPHILLLSILFSICPLISTGVARADPAWYSDPAWDCRKLITIEHTGVTANLTDFPVLVTFTSDSDLAAHARDDGNDILFTSADGTTKLSHEIEGFDGATGELVAWVKIPFLSSAVDTDIYIYYGNATAASQEDVTNVWDSNFEMVQHLKDDPDNAHTQDSTSNDRDGAKSGADNPIETVGKIGRAQYFNNNNISCGNLGIGDNYTAECWIKADTLTGSGDHNTYGFTLMASAVSGQGYPLWLAARGTEIRLWAYEGNPGAGWRETTGAGLNTTDVFYIVATATRSSATKVYVNGIERLSFTNDGDVSWTNIFTLGDLRPGRAIYFEGVIDEVRISNNIRSAEWIETSYNNQSSPASFYNVGLEEQFTPTVTSVSPAKGTTADTAILVTINGTNFLDGAGLAAELNFDGANAIAGTAVTWVSATQITAIFDLSGVTANLDAAWDIKVTNPDARSGTGNDLFTVYLPDPTVVSLTPATSINNGPVNIVNLAGTNFVAGATSVKLQKAGGADIDGSSVVVVSPDKVTCTFDITGAATGDWDVVVTVTGAENPIAVLTGGLTIVAPVPPPPVIGVVPRFLGVLVDILGQRTAINIDALGVLFDSCVLTDPGNSFRLELSKGTGVTSANGGIITGIEMVVCNEPPPTPAGLEIITPVYDITGYTGGIMVPSIVFSKPAKLTLSYNPEWLPENTASIFLGCHDPEHGWTRLKAVSGDTACLGTVSAWINHASLFAVMAELAPAEPELVEPAPAKPEINKPEIIIPPPVEPVPIEPEPDEPEPVAPELVELAPAKFELGHTAVNLAEAKAGRPVTISVIVQNTGELEGSYVLRLEVNNGVEQTREVVLAAGESTEVNFSIIKDEPGTYVVTVGGFTVEFTLMAPVFSPDWIKTNWWLVPSVVIVIGVIVFLLVKVSRRHPGSV